MEEELNEELMGEGKANLETKGEEGEGAIKKPAVLFPQEMLVGLNIIPRTRFKWFQDAEDGTGFLPTFLDIGDMNLTDVKRVTMMPFLWYLDCSENRLTNASMEGVLSKMDLLIYLNVDYNRMESTQLECGKELTLLSMKHNLIKNIDPPNQKRLESLLLDYNLITKLENLGPDTVPNLKNLSMRGNPLMSAAGLCSETLTALFLNSCKINTFDGLEGVPNLEVLNLRGNRIRRMSSFPDTFRALKYINLRDNKIGSPRRLRFLRVCQTLKTVIVTNNRFNAGETGEGGEGDEGRENVLIYLPLTIERLNKKLVTDQERLKVTEMMAIEGFVLDVEEEELEEEEEVDSNAEEEEESEDE